MAKFYVVAGITQFLIKEVEADSKEQAEEIAYNCEFSDWKKTELGDGDNSEHYETLAEGEKSYYLPQEDFK
jgi:hypothetical protein